ncbi:MAG: CopD family protein [Rhodocyclaceae bacterium]|nr:CopD family protein [Rhodocyclaceae bacterium]
MLQNLMLFLHILAVAVWVGGMAFAYLCLRPAALALEPPLRLTLWVEVFKRFFPLVWASIGLILLSGFVRLFQTGFGLAPLAWHLMMASGVIMVCVFVSIWFGPWRAMRAAVPAGDWPRAAAALNAIRQRVAFNLALGAITIAIATLAPGGL